MTAKKRRSGQVAAPTAKNPNAAGEPTREFLYGVVREFVFARVFARACILAWVFFFKIIPEAVCAPKKRRRKILLIMIVDEKHSSIKLDIR